MAQDLLLKQTDEGYLDLVIGEQDFASVDGLETTVAVLLFTDARAAPEEVRSPDKRRGWIGNILRSSELGGKLWLAEQAKNTQEIRNLVVNWAEDSLQPLIDDGLASEVVVTSEKQQRGMKLSVKIITKESGDRAFDFWIATDLSNLVRD